MIDFDVSFAYVGFVLVLICALYWLTREPKFNPQP